MVLRSRPCGKYRACKIPADDTTDYYIFVLRDWFSSLLKFPWLTQSAAPFDKSRNKPSACNRLRDFCIRPHRYPYLFLCVEQDKRSSDLQIDKIITFQAPRDWRLLVDTALFLFRVFFSKRNRHLGNLILFGITFYYFTVVRVIFKKRVVIIPFSPAQTVHGHADPRQLQWSRQYLRLPQARRGR